MSGTAAAAVLFGRSSSNGRNSTDESKGLQVIQHLLPAQPAAGRLQAGTSGPDPSQYGVSQTAFQTSSDVLPHEEEEQRRCAEQLEYARQNGPSQAKEQNGNGVTSDSGPFSTSFKDLTFQRTAPPDLQSVENTKEPVENNPVFIQADIMCFEDARRESQGMVVDYDPGARRKSIVRELGPPPSLHSYKEVEQDGEAETAGRMQTSTGLDVATVVSTVFTGKKKAVSEHDAAARIARLWLNKKYNKYVDKDVFADRLDLEDKLGRGCVRITINVCMFILIIASLSLGIPSAQKLATKNLLTRALDLEAFLDIQTIDGLRDFLPALSENIKVFSASSVTIGGRAVLTQRLEITDPLTIVEFAPRMTDGSWTLSAWVERLPAGVGGNAEEEFLSILRQPMATNRSLNCWGWYHPRQLRYGAHDFFQFDEISTHLEEVVSVPVAAGEDVAALSMETLTLSQGVATFYRNGAKVGEVALPRVMTECINPEPLELGQADLALASVKYYSRALSAYEVDEMYRGGQPLFELASGSGLERLQQEELLQLGVQLEKQGIALTETLDEKEERQVVGMVLGEPLQPDDPLLEADDPTFPPDPSPPAALPGGNLTSEKLPEAELAAWEAAGRPTSGFLTSRWEADPALGGRQYWSVFEDPVHVDGSALADTLPQFDPSAEGMSISLWFKPTTWTRAYGPHLRLLHGAEEGRHSCDGPEETSDFSMRVQLDWVTMEMRAGEGCVRDWRYMTYFDKENGRVKEDFLLSAFAEEPSPVTWRHLLYQYDGATGRLRFYLDGRMAVDSTEPTPSYAVGFHREMSPLKRVSDIFSNMTVVPHSWSRGGSYVSRPGVPGKMAQLRAYPWTMTAEEVLRLHDSATWPLGGALVKQCSDPLLDESYYDTTNLDARRQPCAWYYRMQLRYPYVCRLKWLKAMCPVICSGQRLCHDGKIKVGYTAPPKPRTYWLYDRILYVKPKKEGQSVLCRDGNLDVEQVLRSCEYVAAERAKGEASNLTFVEEDSVYEYYRLLDKLFTGVVRFDVGNCSLLREALLEEPPCTFNTSWMPQFAEDFNKTSTWALTFWLRPKPGSFGMPTNFWFAVKFFSSLAPPQLLNHWHEVQPNLEPWMDAYVHYKSSDGGVARQRAEVWPTTQVDYRQWTMYHFQFQARADGSFRLCGSINAIPLDCKTGTGGQLQDPRQLIQAVEFTTEMLVSPIEVSTHWYSPAAIQLRYYRKVEEMGRVLGPMSATHDPNPADADADTVEAQEALQSFDQRVALLAPPLMFQTRAKQQGCLRKVSASFLQGQVELKRAALCQGGVDCAWVKTEDIATCFDAEKDQVEQYWGNPARKQGFSEFLFAVDSPNIVRPDQDGVKTVVQTRDFLDGLTTTASVLAIFHSPNTGLTTAVELRADVVNPEVKTSVEFQHLGFVDSSQLGELIVAYVAQFLMIAFLLVNAIYFIRRYKHDRHRHHCTYKTEIADYSGDVAQGMVVLAFCVYSLVRAATSEGNIESIVGDIREVSWIDPTVTFTDTVDQFFESVDNFREQLEYERYTNTIAVIILFVVLFRVFAGTAMHPHTGVLVGTVMTSFLDLHHFMVLFMLINCLFAFTATWVFGPEREDFQDLRSSLNTQFSMLLGMDLPEGYDEDPLLVAYVVSCTVVIFFFMLNFLLAVVVEGYMKVREQIFLNEAEFEFFTDLAFTIHAKLKGMVQGWPRKRDLAVKVRKLFVKRVCASHLRLQGLPVQGTVDMFNHYARYKALRCAPPEWKGVQYNYDRADQLSVQSFHRMMNSVEDLRSGMSALRAHLGVEAPTSPQHTSHIPRSKKAAKKLGSVAAASAVGTPTLASCEQSRNGSLYSQAASPDVAPSAIGLGVVAATPGHAPPRPGIRGDHASTRDPNGSKESLHSDSSDIPKDRKQLSLTLSSARAAEGGAGYRRRSVTGAAPRTPAQATRGHRGGRRNMSVGGAGGPGQKTLGPTDAVAMVEYMTGGARGAGQRTLGAAHGAA